MSEITYFRGDSYPKTVTVKDKSTKQAIDITGYSFVMTVDTRQNPDDGTTQVFQVNGVVDPDQVTNKGKVSFTPTTANNDQPIEAKSATFYYDIEMTDPSSNVRTIKKDKYIITQDITK